MDALAIISAKVGEFCEGVFLRDLSSIFKKVLKCEVLFRVSCCLFYRSFFERLFSSTMWPCRIIVEKSPLS